jgi:hypothetical protein
MPSWGSFNNRKKKLHFNLNLDFTLFTLIHEKVGFRVKKVWPGGQQNIHV